MEQASILLGQVNALFSDREKQLETVRPELREVITRLGCEGHWTS